MKVPIACSLTADGAKDRVAEWRDALATDVEQVEVGGTVARLRLRSGDEALGRIVDLAEREQECCPFFGFSIDLVHGERWLRISVPDDGATILDDLVSLLPPAIAGSPGP